ncbi:2-hydroxychromene-2-carboxylate isomerase [Ferrovibrio sp.]|uniref:2-hydroxychromene-2-carboxylate isomerase n=1 Tax=Ferrovibrio sp. TaxID=1917215 RepID=UPI000CC04C93|nr:2-hydroxychromene-2-carboxylate isomerase [Ferrovibrio sp.]PJI44321.1 MAG: 2-hydroxychromene-2-carboxylate isomerase [Ferrovibrio sp.]
MGRRLAIWFDYASPYSYLAVSRIAALRDVILPEATIEWQPFLLGPIFMKRASGAGAFQDVSPAERQYRWRDLERLCALYSLPWQKPRRYPPRGLLAARVTLVALRQGWGEACIRAIYRAGFADDRDIADPTVLGAVIADLGQKPDEILSAAQNESVKAQLRTQVDAAMASGIFGAPSLVVDGEIFWGNDRLEQGLAWARQVWM